MATTGAYGSGNVNIGATAASVFRPNIWSKEVLMFVKSNLVLLPLIKHYDADVQSSGQTLEIPNVSAISANLKSQNTVVTLNYNTETKTTLTLNRHYESSFIVEDLVKVQSAYDLRSDYTQAAAYAIAEKVDSDLAIGMTTAWKTASQVSGAYGTAIADANILAINRYLSENKAPRTDRSLVVHPKGESELLNIDKFVRYDALGTGEAIKTGKLGTIYGVTVYMSQNLVYLDTATDEYNHLFFHKEAWAVAMQLQPRTQAQYKQEYLGWLVTVDVLYGHVGLRGNFGYVLKS
jgi:N4-gp56 family major capsid protein